MGNGGINCGENDNSPNEHSLAASVATDSRMTARGGGILHGDALTILRTLPGESIHMCVTSPPYWGLRDYKVAGQLGLEAVHDCLGWATKQPCGECYICHMTEVFREVRRVLRADGTLWINEGDSYSGGGQNSGSKPEDLTEKQRSNGGCRYERSKIPTGLKPKDLCGMPWRLALSLQADGWYWRDAIVWDKPAPMPESVRDRCTKSWEPILMFAKSQRYYFDQEAIREKSVYPEGYKVSGSLANAGRTEQLISAQCHRGDKPLVLDGTRNKRNVWRLPPMPVSAAHFATYPLELPETCILAGTSERGVCPECGAPWKRQVQRTTVGDLQERRGDADLSEGKHTWPSDYTPPSTTGWLPSCKCIAEYAKKAGICDNALSTEQWEALADTTAPHFKPQPATVLDPFAGSGTTGLAALKHGRNFLGIELSAEYIQIAEERLADKLSLFA